MPGPEQLLWPPQRTRTAEARICVALDGAGHILAASPDHVAGIEDRFETASEVFPARDCLEIYLVRIDGLCFCSSEVK